MAAASLIIGMILLVDLILALRVVPLAFSGDDKKKANFLCVFSLILLPLHVPLSVLVRQIIWRGLLRAGNLSPPSHLSLDGRINGRGDDVSNGLAAGLLTLLTSARAQTRQRNPSVLLLLLLLLNRSNNRMKSSLFFLILLSLSNNTETIGDYHPSKGRGFEETSRGATCGPEEE